MRRMSLTNAPVRVSVGGQPAQATYPGVAPGFAGLERLNVIVPAGLGPGGQLVSPSTADPAMRE